MLTPIKALRFVGVSNKCPLGDMRPINGHPIGSACRTSQRVATYLFFNRC
jgi:hypothetical protein